MRNGLLPKLCFAAVLAAGIGQAFGDPPMYTMVELAPIAPSSTSVAAAISDPTAAGPVVVGQSFTRFSAPTLSWRAVAWRPNISTTPTDLLTSAQAGDGTVNRAQDVSPSGMFIVGYSNVSPPHGVRWSFNPTTGAVTGAQTLRALSGDGAGEAVGVNSSGRAAGYSLTDSSTLRATTWAPGSATAILLATPSGSGGIRLARRVSEAPLENIVGRSDWSSTPTTRPVIWKQSSGVYGTGQLLGLLSSSQVHDAVGITSSGLTAVGLGATATTATGVSWNTSTNAVAAIGSICCSQNVVYDMNNAGVGVGYTGLNFETFRAVLYWQGQAFDLNTRVANNPQIGQTLFLYSATGINSAGQIVGMFGNSVSEEPLAPGRVFLLTPVPGT